VISPKLNPDSHAWASAYAALGDFSSAVLHREILRGLEADAPRSVVDYGCGDGRLAARIPAPIALTLFDSNQSMLDLAGTRLAERKPTLIRAAQSLAGLNADAVVCSLVLMMAPSAPAFEAAVRDLSGCLKPGGSAYVGVTHPCFRDRQFRDFTTQYVTDPARFDYAAEAQPYTVKIDGNGTTADVEILDYHWSLQHTLNTMIAAGFRITRFAELFDPDAKPGVASRFPPYVLITARRE
jgi:SAM-dependent methyltransferase